MRGKEASEGVKLSKKIVAIVMIIGSDNRYCHGVTAKNPRRTQQIWRMFGRQKTLADLKHFSTLLGGSSNPRVIIDKQAMCVQHESEWKSRWNAIISTLCFVYNFRCVQEALKIEDECHELKWFDWVGFFLICFCCHLKLLIARKNGKFTQTRALEMLRIFWIDWKTVRIAMHTSKLYVVLMRKKSFDGYI